MPARHRNRIALVGERTMRRAARAKAEPAASPGEDPSRARYRTAAVGPLEFAANRIGDDAHHEARAVAFHRVDAHRPDDGQAA